MRFLLLLLLYVSSLFSIIDIATVDFGDKKKGFSGSAYGSFEKKRGNTHKDEAQYGGRIQYDTKKTVSWIQGEIEHDKASGITTDDNAFMHLRHIRQLYDPAWAAEFYAQLKKDKFTSIKNRTLFGTGLRYRIMNTEAYGKLFLGVSVLDERISYTDSSIDPFEHNYRTSSYLSYKLRHSDVVEFSYLGYYQPKIQSPSDYRIASIGEMTVHVSKVFDLSYLLEFDYDSVPASGIAPTDVRQRLSFIYRFGEDDPLSSYAQNFLQSVEQLDDENSSDIVAVEVQTDVEEIKDSTDTLVGEWVFGEERFVILLDGKGSYHYGKGIYDEKVEWTLVSTQTQEGIKGAKAQSTKLVIIRFVDEEGRLERVENYLWSEDALVGLSGTTVRLFKR